jgi:hypothetical protein
MSIKKWNLALTGALAIALLSGCGSKSDNASAGNGDAQVQTDNGSAQGSQGQGGRGGFGGGMVDANGNTADMLGKIKSINGNTITVYKSSFDPSQMGGGMRGGQGGQGGDGGQPPSGAPDANGGQAPADGQMPSGAPDGQVPSGAPDGGNGGGRQGGGMANMFTDETVDITVTDATVIQKTSFENNETTTTDVALSDLKADDVLTIWLTEGTQEAATIKIGGFGGGFGGGMGRGGQGGQGQAQDGQAPAASASASSSQ